MTDPRHLKTATCWGTAASGHVSLTTVRQVSLWIRDTRARKGINSWRSSDILSGGFQRQSSVPKYGVINLSKLLKKPQCPGTCSGSWKGCSILVLGLLSPMSAANMLKIQPLPSHYSDWIRGKTVPGQTTDHIHSAVLKVLSLSSGFLLQTTWQAISTALCTGSRYHKELPLLQLDYKISKPQLYFINRESVPYMLTGFLLNVIRQLLRL